MCLHSVLRGEKRIQQTTELNSPTLAVLLGGQRLASPRNWGGSLGEKARWNGRWFRKSKSQIQSVSPNFTEKKGGEVIK